MYKGIRLGAAAGEHWFESWFFCGASLSPFSPAMYVSMGVCALWFLFFSVCLPARLLYVSFLCLLGSLRLIFFGFGRTYMWRPSKLHFGTSPVFILFAALCVHYVWERWYSFALFNWCCTNLLFYKKKYLGIITAFGWTLSFNLNKDWTEHVISEDLTYSDEHFSFSHLFLC